MQRKKVGFVLFVFLFTSIVSTETYGQCSIYSEDPSCSVGIRTVEDSVRQMPKTFKELWESSEFKSAAYTGKKQMFDTWLASDARKLLQSHSQVIPLEQQEYVLKQMEDYFHNVYTEDGAKQGDAEAQYILARMYFNGEKRFSKNIPKAIYWYQKSAEQGYEPAKIALRNLGY